MTRVLYLIFFASGAAGLVYQVLWLRLTGLVFGNTYFSIAIVLSAFMAGLALGNWRIGILSDRAARPLRLYGFLEILIGVSAWLVPPMFALMDGVYWNFASALRALPGADFAVRFVGSFSIMLLPTFLMGGTLPVMARFFVRRLGEVEAKLATLYALNTFGAAVGVLAAALLLIPALGNQATTTAIASVNVIVGLLAIVLDRRLPAISPAALTDSPDEPERAADPAADRLVLAAVAVSGFVALLYEVAWTRALTALISNSTYAFAIMLVTFLVGIALGSSWAARYRPAASLRLLGVFQLAIAVGGLVFLVGYVHAPGVLVSLVRALYYSFPAVLTIQFLVCALLMLGATFFMGATLPIGAQLYSNSMVVLGRRIGGVYSVNTLGAIAGSLAAGFLLIPTLGTERAVLIGLACNALLALVLFGKPLRMALLPVASIALFLLAAFGMRGEVFWEPGMLDRGVLIYAREFENRPKLTIDEHYGETEVVFFEEGKNASVSVRRGSGYVGLRTNGKVDASNGNDKKTQLLLSYLPGFHHRAPEKVLVVGYGSGITSGVATVFPSTSRIDTVEIEPAVVSAGEWFANYNRRSWEHPKVRIIEQDARNFLSISDESYDLIISEPSNPWIAGIGNLFTAEFYALAARALEPDGIFAQWLPLYELSPENVQMVLGELLRQFPEVSVWHMDTGDIIVLASRRPLRLESDVIDKLWANDASVRRDFRQFLELDRPLALLAHYVTDTQGVREYTAGAARNTDDRPRLEYAAPRNLYAQTLALNVELLNQYKHALLPNGLDARTRERALLAVVDAYLANDNFDFASRAVTELATSTRLSDASLYLAMASATIYSRQLDDAESALEKAALASGDPDPYAAYHAELRARLSEQQGNWNAAIDHYRRAARLDKDRPDYLLRIANLFAFLRRYADAATWLERFLESDPYPRASFETLLGDYLLADGRETEAVAAFERAIAADPYSQQARLRLADYHLQQGDVGKAAELLEFLSVHAVDRSPEIYEKLAQIYIERGETKAGARILDKGARIFPNSVTIYNRRRQLDASRH